MTTKENIQQWFEEGLELGASHLLVVCDTFDHEDYPVYVKLVSELPPPTNQYDQYERVKPVLDVREFVTNNYGGQNMQRTMEVYKMADPMQGQLNTHRCFRY